MHLQVQDYMTKLSDAERQVAKQKLLANRSQTRATQAEQDIDDLR